MMFGRVFFDHPAAVNESYAAHFAFALGFSLKLMAASGAAIVHAFIPCLFEKTASRLVAELYAKTNSRG